jgi:hypothetical protein
MHNFRPPSAGPHKDDTAGHYYRLMLKHVNTVLSDPGKYCKAYDPKQGYEIAGFVWFQGFNDVIKGTETYDWYTELLAQFIRDVRKDLKTPEMPFVIGVIGMTSTKMDNMLKFRKAQAATADIPEFKGNVIAVQAADYWDTKLSELENRAGAAEKERYDRAGKYKELREKLAPIRMELDALEGRSKESLEKRAELKEKIRDMIYTNEEQEYLRLNKSNAAFHYMGSAKIYSRIGEAFAEAQIQLQGKTVQANNK